MRGAFKALNRVVTIAYRIAGILIGIDKTGHNTDGCIRVRSDIYIRTAKEGVRTNAANQRVVAIAAD